MRPLLTTAGWRAGTLPLRIVTILASVALVSCFAEYSKSLSNQPKNSATSELVTVPLVGKMSFRRGGWIYLTNLVTGKETKLSEGISPRLSPNGDALVYLDSTEKESVLEVLTKSASRLRILNLVNGQVQEFENLRDVDAFNAIWSNDGKRIAFSISRKDERGIDLAIMDASSGKWETVAERLGHEVTTDLVWLDSWGPDDQSFLFHSLGALYEARIDGSRISRPAQKLPLVKPFAAGEITSASTFLLSPDRRYLLFDHVIDLGEKGPNKCISVFDLNTQILRRITPGNIEANGPSWLLPTNDILFTCIADSSERLRFDICTVKLGGTGLRVILRDGEDVSYAPQ